MADDRKRPEAPRVEKVLPGVWRLRLALPWPGVPHGNVWAVAADGGIVLFDTGIGGKGRMRQFDLALAQVGFGLEDVRLLVCTHSHTDHYGLAAPIVEGAGCELWMHPAWEHVRLLADDPAAALEQRLEVARQSGVPAAALERYRESRSGDEETGIDAIVEPDRDLLPGVEVETDLGTWQVHETPGHAPSHVVLHQPERKLMISGDHLLGRTVLFFDHGHSPDPVGEFLARPRRGRAARGRPLPARPRPPLPRPRGQDRRGAAAGRRAARQDPRVARRGREAALRGGRRHRRRREPEHAGQRLGPADRPLLPRPPGDPRRGREGRGDRPAALEAGVGGPGPPIAFGAVASFTFTREVAAPAEIVFEVLTDHRRYSELTPLRKSVLEREGEPAPNGVGAIRKLTAVGPALREEVIAYESPGRFSYTLLSGLPVRDHVGTVELTAQDGTGPGWSTRCARSRPCRSSAAVVVAVVKQAVKGLVDGVVKESERRAAAGG